MTTAHTDDPLGLLKVVTWRVPRVGAAELEAVTVRDGEAAEFLAAVRDGLAAAEIVHFPTCQRVLLAATTPLSLEEARERVASAFQSRAGVPLPQPEAFEGFTAFSHIAEVASSLDSLVPGEAQVLGQLKDAFQKAVEDGLAGKRGRGLTHAFPLAFRAAKAVRASTDLFRGRVSLIPLTLDAIHERLAGSRDPVVAVVGTGEIGAKMAELLEEDATRPRVVRVSRNPARGVSLAAFLGEPARVDVIAFATPVEAPLFTREHAEAFLRANPGGDLLLVDLSLPRAVESAAGELPGVRLLALDELTALSEQAKAARRAELDRARGVLATELAKIEAEYAAIPAQRALAAYRKDVEAVAAERFARGEERFPEAFADPEFRKWFDQTVRAVAHVAQKRLTERSEER